MITGDQPQRAAQRVPRVLLLNALRSLQAKFTDQILCLQGHAGSDKRAISVQMTNITIAQG